MKIDPFVLHVLPPHTPTDPPPSTLHPPLQHRKHHPCPRPDGDSMDTDAASSAFIAPSDGAVQLVYAGETASLIGTYYHYQPDIASL